MIIGTLQIIELVELLGVLIILYVTFDTIKRTRGSFNHGLKALFFGFSLLFVLEVLEHFSILNSLFTNFELLDELMELIFVVIMFATVLIINNKVKEIHDGKKKRKKK